MGEVLLFYLFINTIIYLLIIIIAIYVYKLFDKKSKKIQLIDILMIVALIIITGIRFDVGSDYTTYLDQFKNLDIKQVAIRDIFQDNYQFGFDLLSYILKIVTTNDYIIFWAVSLIIYPLLIVYMRKNTEIVWFAFGVFILMGFFDVSMNILKQQIAMVLILFSYEYLIDKKYLKFVLLVGLAGVFHVTSLFAALLLVISRYIKPSYKNLLLSILIGTVGLFTYKYILSNLFRYNTVFSVYKNYILFQDSGILDRDYRVYSIVGYVFVFIILTFIILSKKNNLKSILDKKYNMISLLFIGIIINIIAIDYWVLNRISLYMYQFIIVILPAYLKVKMNKKERLINSCLIVFIIFGWFFIFIAFGGNNLSYTFKTYLLK